jgi:cellulose biosynthesis protein BcsQ
MATVAVYSLKGGVGKSTFAVNLAHLAATLSGRRTLLWDLDAQGASGFLMRQEARDAHVKKVFSRDADPADHITETSVVQLDLLAADASLRQLDVQLVEEDARKRLRKLVRTLERDYDLIVLDCPPGLTELTEQIFRAADVIVVPVPPSQLGLRAYRQVAEHAHRYFRDGPALLPVFSMVDRRKRLHREMLTTHPDWLAIPSASVVEQMSVHREPLARFAPRHPATLAFVELWAGIAQHLAEREGPHRREADVGACAA